MNNNWKVLQGDVVDQIKNIPNNSIDAILTDPPYNLGMDIWDKWPSNKHFREWCTLWGKECFRVLKPSGTIMSFGASKTYHHMACGLEEAGFLPKDLIEWIYWSTMPKNKSLKSCHEPIFYGVKPPIINITINIDDCRIPIHFNKKETEHILLPRIPEGKHPGRKAYSGTTETKKYKQAIDDKPYSMNEGGRHPYNVITDGLIEDIVCIPNILDIKKPRGKSVVAHPTQKPVSLMMWLMALTTKSNDLILDCFGGSGTTGVAALIMNRDIILIEKEPSFIEIITNRLTNI